MSQLTLEYPASKRSEQKNAIFEQMHNSTNWYTIQEDGWHLPAIDEPKEDCGKWLTKGCLDYLAHEKCNHAKEHYGKVFVKSFQKSCYRAICMTCFKKWMARESNKSKQRIKKYEKMTSKHVKHIIISVPRWEYYTEKKVMAKKAYKILKELGCEGGAVVFHPFRKHVIYVKDEIKFEWYYSPHFHVLGFGWIEGVAENYQKNGWIVKNKGTRDSTFATIYYILSHAGIKKHNHSLVWFGNLSYSKLKIEKEPENNVCPCCSAKMNLVFHYGLWGYTPPPKTEVDAWCEPEGWLIAESTHYEGSRNPRPWDYNEGFEGIGSLVKDESMFN